MRIALIGDLQYQLGSEEEIRVHMAQVEACHPDLAVFLGDMGSHKERGSKIGMGKAREFLELLSCPKRVLLGNHDVEYLPERDPAPEQEKWYTEIFGAEHPWSSFTVGDVLVLCVSIEQQPLSGHMTRHAVYVSDGQYEWVRSQIHAHGSKPVILISHAPAPGSGLRCFPPTHAAAVDNFLEHTFQPERWRSLIDGCGQLRLWCSGHFHMGHDYEGAMCLENNLLHVSCGVMTDAARDNTRMTRFLELSGDEAVIFTLDHLSGPSALREDARVDLRGENPPTGHYTRRENFDVFIGPDEAEHVYLWRQLRRAYIPTKGGLLWEYDLALRELTGAIVRGRRVTRVSAAGKKLIWEEEDGIFGTDITLRSRFDILGGCIHAEVSPCEMPESTLPEIGFTSELLKEGSYLRFNPASLE